ncbi:MAG: OmpA family protein [gamma proteobacterium symbiont of Bathyaustriella thionipta]|nr:OmpA family protein [gamma proteobacterium symbiont of Bathyaustriella thionipta]
MKKTITFISIAAVLGLAGCGTPVPRDLDGLDSKITEAESGDFGKCMAESHAAGQSLDTAKTILATSKSKAYWTETGSYAQEGHAAAEAGMAHRKAAEEACTAWRQPIIDRLDELDGRVSYLESLHEVLKGVTFQTGSANLTAQARTVLDVIANALQRRPVNVEIGGYASQTGGEEFNMELSQKRAESVMNYLASRGVDSSLMSAKGYGWNDPIADNSTRQGQLQNQRVELHRQ